MFWLARPAYARWAAAVLVVIAAAAADLHGRATVPYPFTTDSVMAGAVVTDADVVWRRVPHGLLPPAPQLDMAAAVDLGPGEPVTPAAVTTAADVPEGWWSVPVEIPEAVGVGVPVRLVAVDPPLDTEGIVSRPTATGTFSLATPGLVAVPPEVAGAVAVAASTGTLMVLIGT